VLTSSPMISLKVPGSKSLTNRALIIAALATTKTRLNGCLFSDDTRAMIKSLKALGVGIEREGSSVIVRPPKGGRLTKPRGRLSCGNSGTSVRFLSALLATQPFSTLIDGDNRMRERPLKDLTDALSQLGASVGFLQSSNCPPVEIAGPLAGGACTLRGTMSSQYLSALLMAAPYAQKSVTISVKGGLSSKPYVDLTIALMAEFGVVVGREGYRRFTIKAGQRYRRARALDIEGDASAASYFWALGALLDEPIDITNVPDTTLQPDKGAFLKALHRVMRTKSEGGLELSGEAFPDAAMTLAVVCALRPGQWRLSGLHTLRVKECDRLRALATELRKLGVKVKEEAEALTINGREPTKLHGATIETYNDHRMAMCFGLAGLLIPGVTVLNPGCVRKTYPTFWKDLKMIQKRLDERLIVISGMRGTGKSTLGRELAQRLRRPFYDLDEEVERRLGKKIVDLVAEKGWEAFREEERKTVALFVKKRGAVLATGGGTLMDESSQLTLKAVGKILILDAPPEVLIKRLKKSKNRPSLTGTQTFLDELSSVYQERKARYLAAADSVFDVSITTTNKQADRMKKVKGLVEIVRMLGFSTE